MLKKNGIWQTYLLYPIGVYQYAKNYQNIPKSSSAMAVFITDHGRTDGCPHTRMGIYVAADYEPFQCILMGFIPLAT